MYKKNRENRDLNSIASSFSAFDEASCAEIIRIAKESDSTTGSIYQDNLSVDKTIRSSKIFYIDEQTYGGLYDTIKQIFKAANDWRFSISSVPAIQVIRYGIGDKYEKHTDWSPNNLHRKLSLSIQLSQPTDYEGGEVLFHAGPEPVEMPFIIGNGCVWPSFVLHEVKPVTSGERWALVAWAHGEKFA